MRLHCIRVGSSGGKIRNEFGGREEHTEKYCSRYDPVLEAYLVQLPLDHGNALHGFDQLVRERCATVIKTIRLPLQAPHFEMCKSREGILNQ